MYIHQTHSFYIIARLSETKGAPEGYLEKKYSIFESALSNIGVEKINNHDDVWQLKDVMYASAEDVYDIISNEMIRLVSKDSAISSSEKKLYELSSLNDKIIVSEYLRNNTYTL